MENFDATIKMMYEMVKDGEPQDDKGRLYFKVIPIMYRNVQTWKMFELEYTGKRRVETLKKIFDKFDEQIREIIDGCDDLAFGGAINDALYMKAAEAYTSRHKFMKTALETLVNISK